jgi:hypothetical protein
MERNLQRLTIEEGISFEDFRTHRADIEAERAELTALVETIRSRRSLVKADFDVALNLAQQLGFLFDRGNLDEKRLLCETVLKRVYVKERRIVRIELNPPSASSPQVLGVRNPSSLVDQVVQ